MKGADDEIVKLDAQIEQLRDACEFAWTIICNAGEGDWTRESADWQGAAARFREQYHALLADGILAPTPEQAVP